MKKGHGYWNETERQQTGLNTVKRINFRMVVNSANLVESDVLKRACVLIQLIKLVQVLVDAHEEEEEVLYTKIKKWSIRYITDDIEASNNVGNYATAICKLENATLFTEGKRGESMLTQNNTKLFQLYYLKEQTDLWRKLLQVVIKKSRHEAKVNFVTSTNKFLGTQYRILITARIQPINDVSAATWIELHDYEGDIHDKEQIKKLEKNVHWGHL